MLQTGDIVLQKADNLYSRLIRRATMSAYGHVGIVATVDYDKGTCVVAEALNNGFVNNQYMIKDIINQYDVVSVFNKLNKTDRKKIRDFIVKNTGTPYDWKAIIAIIVHLITGRVLFKDDADKFICSEVVVTLYYDIFGVKLSNKESFLVTPDDIAKSPYVTLVYYNGKEYEENKDNS